MRQNSFRTLYAIFSALLISCASNPTGPIVAVCISKPSLGGFECVDINQKGFKIPYDQSENYIGFDPASAQEVLTTCHMRDQSH
jgi:hypothetical protein